MPEPAKILRQPNLHGFVSAILMVVFELCVVRMYSEPPSWLLPVQLIILGASILLFIFLFQRTAKVGLRFMELFQAGFRHFITATLTMVLFTYVQQKRHPEYAKMVAKQQRDQMKSTGRYTDTQLDELSSQTEKQFATVAIYGSVFRYLISGAFFAAAGSLAFSRKN